MHIYGLGGVFPNWYIRKLPGLVSHLYFVALSKSSTFQSAFSQLAWGIKQFGKLNLSSNFWRKCVGEFGLRSVCFVCYNPLFISWIIKKEWLAFLDQFGYNSVHDLSSIFKRANLSNHYIGLGIGLALLRPKNTLSREHMSPEFWLLLVPWE